MSGRRLHMPHLYKAFLVGCIVLTAAACGSDPTKIADSANQSDNTIGNGSVRSTATGVGGNAGDSTLNYQPDDSNSSVDSAGSAASAALEEGMDIPQRESGLIIIPDMTDPNGNPVRFVLSPEYGFRSKYNSPLGVTRRDDDTGEYTVILSKELEGLPPEYQLFVIDHLANIGKEDGLRDEVLAGIERYSHDPWEILEELGFSEKQKAIVKEHDEIYSLQAMGLQLELDLLNLEKRLEAEARIKALEADRDAIAAHLEARRAMIESVERATGEEVKDIYKEDGVWLVVFENGEIKRLPP